MPELPEVETLRRGLVESILDKAVESVDVFWERTLDAPRSAIGRVAGHRLANITRRGKVLIWDLDDDLYLLIHPRMTGQLVVTEDGRTLFGGGHPSRSMQAVMPHKTTRAVIHLSDDISVFLNDQRKFARIRIVDTASLTADPFFLRLGPEPLSDAFTVAALSRQLRHHARAPIKAVLLEQSTVAGLGNIYTDEALHLARIYPQRLAGALSTGEVRRLRASIRQVIATAIDKGGTTYTSAANLSHTGERWGDEARVFQRQGQPCPACGTRLERIRVAGRGTNFCPDCQPYGEVGGMAMRSAHVRPRVMPLPPLRSGLA